MGLREETLEQPDAAQRLLDAAPAVLAPISAAFRSRRPRFAVIAARGASDNAGIYAQYLLAIRNGLVVALAAPSTITLYDARPNMAEALVVGISQSGRSPDIIAVVDEARRQGAMTVVLTNARLRAWSACAGRAWPARVGRCPERPGVRLQVALLTRLKEDHGARLLVIYDSPGAREIDDGLTLPDGIPPWLAPIVDIVPAQLYAYHLTVARGLSPDHPRSISKVTETR